MLINTHGGLFCLLVCLPIITAIPHPTPAPEVDLGLIYNRGLLGRQQTPSGSLPVNTGPSSQSSSTRNTDPDPEETPPTSTSTSTSSSTTTTQPTTSPTTTPPTSAPPASTTSRRVSTDEDGQVFTTVVVVEVTPSSSSPSPSSTAAPNSSGPGKGTFIGLGVAGGIAVLALAGFLVWKFTQKRFSQFDDDGGEINWPVHKEEQLKPPVAPATNMASNATTSSIDLTRDAYAVPPVPQHTTPYYDDPSGTAAAAYYDPYRGPVPQTFYSPPQSTEGHHQAYGEAIPMSTYSSGRQSPGPNMAYDDPYAGRRSPGPALAYGGGPAMMDPTGRVGTPVGRIGTPVGRVGTPMGGGYAVQGVPPHGVDMLRAGTPQAYGRASPGPNVAYGAHINPYDRHTPGPYGS